MTFHMHIRTCRWVIRDGISVCTAEGQFPRPVQPQSQPARSKRRWFSKTP
jgi:hypothetical protein